MVEQEKQTPQLSLLQLVGTYLNSADLQCVSAALQMAEDAHLMDCFECGSCTFACPSHIPLVQYFRMGKKMVRKLSAA